MIAPSEDCIVPDCMNTPTKLYPGGRYCEDHKPGRRPA